jgi:hypothetical protein
MTVTAMSMDVVCEKNGHQVVMNAPSVCMTPCAPSPVPIPYPYFSDAKSLAEKCSRIKIHSKGVHASRAGKTKSGKGNEPGSAAVKNITVAGVNKGKAWCFPIPCVTIHFEGSPINVTGNLGMGDSR